MFVCSCAVWTAVQSAGGAHKGSGGPKPGERRVRRIINWTDVGGVQHTREIILSDTTGEGRQHVFLYLFLSFIFLFEVV